MEISTSRRWDGSSRPRSSPGFARYRFPLASRLCGLPEARKSAFSIKVSKSMGTPLRAFFFSKSCVVAVYGRKSKLPRRNTLLHGLPFCLSFLLPKTKYSQRIASPAVVLAILPARRLAKPSDQDGTSVNERMLRAWRANARPPLRR